MKKWNKLSFIKIYKLSLIKASVLMLRYENIYLKALCKVFIERRASYTKSQKKIHFFAS